MSEYHVPALLNESLASLAIKPDGIYVDATFGGGGHSAEICRKYPGIKIITIDQDQSVWGKIKSKFEDSNCDISFTNANFRDLDKVLKQEKVEKVDGIIFSGIILQIRQLSA